MVPHLLEGGQIGYKKFILERPRRGEVIYQLTVKGHFLLSDLYEAIRGIQEPLESSSQVSQWEIPASIPDFKA